MAKFDLDSIEIDPTETVDTVEQPSTGADTKRARKFLIARDVEIVPMHAEEMNGLTPKELKARARHVVRELYTQKLWVQFRSSASSIGRANSNASST